ncbi:hypothetical protein D3C72_1362610 [compost metagenome]
MMPSNTVANIWVCSSPIEYQTWLTTILCIMRCELGTPAMRCASASVASSSCAAGTAKLAKPQSAACVPVMVSPVNMSCLARKAPRR